MRDEIAHPPRASRKPQDPVRERVLDPRAVRDTISRPSAASGRTAVDVRFRRPHVQGALEHPGAALVNLSSPSLVFVVGAAGGIGSAFCRRLAARGAKLVLAGRNAETLRALKARESMHALGRIGEPEDVASLLDWLLDPAQSWVTGQVFGVDGGLSTLRARRR